MSAYKTEIFVSCQKFVVDTVAVEIWEVVGAVDCVVLHKKVFHEKIPRRAVVFAKLEAYSTVFEGLHLTVGGVDLSTSVTDEKLTCEMSFNCTV